MASKEVMVTAPLAVLLYDRTFLSASFREALRDRYRLYGGLASTWLVLAAAQVATSHPTAGFGLGHLTPWGYAMTQPGVILHYLRLALWPSPLVIDYYGWPIVRGITPAALVVAGLLGATLWATRITAWPVLLALQGRTDDAIAEYSEALRLNPNHAQAHAGLGAALTRQGKRP